jgi:prepilin-type N-terminal cleavage/methylation domain-containing protein
MKKQKGFTLVELMIVIAIIALLTAIMTANFSSAKARSRDSKRISDLAQLQLALAGFFDRCSYYPTSLDVTDSGGSCTSGGVDVNMGTFISVIPKPPTGGTGSPTNYDYYTISPTANATGVFDYVLHTSLEVSESSATQNGLPAYPPSSWTGMGGGYTFPATGISCDNTSTSVNYCVGSK